MASSPITPWQVEGEKVEVVTDFLLLGSKITADGDCSHETRKQLLLGKKAMTNLDSALKNRDINLPTNVHIVKAMVLPVVMYNCAKPLPAAFSFWCQVEVGGARGERQKSSEKVQDVGHWAVTRIMERTIAGASGEQ